MAPRSNAKGGSLVTRRVHGRTIPCRTRGLQQKVCGPFGQGKGDIDMDIDIDTDSSYGWLSKLWSPFGSPKYWLPYYNRTHNRTIVLTTTHVDPLGEGGAVVRAMCWWQELDARCRRGEPDAYYNRLFPKPGRYRDHVI